MSDSFIRPGGMPIPSEVPVATDNTSILGDGSYYHPLTLNGNQPFARTTIAQFVRTDGVDTIEADGSALKPYRTVKYAVTKWPTDLAPGQDIDLDCSGIGVEAFPVNYCLPVVNVPALTYGADFSTPGFMAGPVVRIKAVPQSPVGFPTLEMTISLGDGVEYGVDPDTNLVVLSITADRPSWATNALYGKKLLRTDLVTASCAIFGSDNNVVPGKARLFLDNTSAGLGGALSGGNTFQIVESSATFLVQPGAIVDEFGDANGGMVVNINGFGMQGIDVLVDGGSGFDVAFELTASTFGYMELCTFQGISVTAPAGGTELGLIGCVVSRFAFGFGEGFFFQNSLLTGIFQFYAYAGYSFQNCTVDASAPIQNAIAGEVIFHSDLAMINCLVRGSIAVFATGDGIIMNGGSQILQFVQVNGAAGNGIVVNNGTNFVRMTHVTGTGNAALGLSVDDGSQIRLLTPDTTITGAGGDLKVGSLPVRSWGTAPATPVGNFYFDTPVENEYDLVTPFATNAGSGLATPIGTDGAPGASTGSRVFVRE